MAKIYIEPAKAKSTLNQQQALERALQTLSQDLGDICRRMDYKISGKEAIDARLRDAMNQINKEVDSTKALRTGLEQIIARYEQTENGNRDRVAAEKTSVQSTANAGGTQQAGNGTDSGESPPEFDWGKLFKDEILKLLGPLGIVASGTEKLWEGDVAGALTKLIDLIGKGAKTVIDKPSAEWFKDLFGFGKDGLKIATDAPNFWEELVDFSSPGKTVGTVASWATSFLDSFIKNTEEGLTGGRFWGETFTEMGIDLLEGAAIGTVVGLVMGTSAPVLAVAAATVAVTAVVDWGLDSLVYWLTDGAQSSWVEAASDLICDTAEKIIDAVGPVVTKVVDKGKEVIDKGIEAVTDTIDKGVNWVKSWFGGGKSKAASGGGGSW